MKSFKTIKIALLSAVLTIGAFLSYDTFAQSSIMRGEVTPANYVNAKADSNGNLYTISAPATVSGSALFSERSGTITVGGTSQTLSIPNGSRRYIFIQNNSAGDLWINFGTAATVGQPSILLIAGSSYSLGPMVINTQTIFIIGATTGQSFTAKEQ